MPRFQSKTICNMLKSRVFASALVVTAGLSLVVGVTQISAEAVWAPNRTASDSPEGHDSLKKVKGHVREGTRLVDQRGFFKHRGDGATFHAKDGSFKIEGLENLGLQRVVRTISSSNKPGEIEWLVSGLITEFQGLNYLFLDRAIQLNKAPTSVKSQ